jgi:DNA (cytosine-5)-methyltransferase 1
MRGMNRPVPPGYPGHSNDACKLNDSIRALTTLERALIQTFPADFKWKGNKTDMEQMIGNAVPVKLAEFVAGALNYHINNQHISDKKQLIVDYGRFYDWLRNMKRLSERAERDTISRLKRANTICEIQSFPDSYYIFKLEQSNGYKNLSPTIRSQLKRAVSLYSDYYMTAYQQFTLETDVL